MKATKDAALKKLKELDLSFLGTQDALEKYLLEEFREIDLSKKWDSLPQGTNLANPNNILLYYLLGTHKLPSELNHKFVDADSPDVDCFESDTPIKTKDDNKAAKDIQIGDILYDSNNQETEVLLVQVRHSKAEEQLYRITYDDGSSVVYSANHRHFVNGKWFTSIELFSDFPDVSQDNTEVRHE